MPVRLTAASMLLVALAACGGGSAASGPPSTSGSGPGGASAGPVDPGGTAGPPIDLSGLDACALLDDATVERLTGETGFITDDLESGHCFWGVPRPGVPQYVEIRVFARPGGLSGYTFSPGAGCSSGPVTGVGSEAMGGTCSTPQEKVYLVAWDRGVAVQVLVNEPKAPLTPASLGATALAVLDGLE